jgi:poly-gamma-glutamate capsule biosynthesis protein CapA/YwtB (metallophosphatase superfamily)
MTGAGGRCGRRTAAAVALAAAVGAGCTAPAPESAAPTGSPRPAATPLAPPAGDAVHPTSRPGPVRLAFAGDVHFEGVLADRLRDPATALAPATAALAEADLAIVNLETSVGGGGRPEPGKRFTFSAGPEAFTALAAAGVDVVSMANNHALDFGRARLPSTLRAVRAAAAGVPPLSVIGIGRDRQEAFVPALTDVDGVVVGTLAASVADQDPTADRTGHWAASGGRSGVADALDPVPLLDRVRRLDDAVDVVVVYLHWGVQGERCPSADQRALAARLVRSGADIVVGSHAHQLQGDGRLGGGYVAYGLGNLAWYSPGTTGVLTLTVRAPVEPAGRAEVTRSRWWPGRIGTDGLPVPITGPGVADFRAERRALRACAGLR